jgi:hypothetical protein
MRWSLKEKTRRRKPPITLLPPPSLSFKREGDKDGSRMREFG